MTMRMAMARRGRRWNVLVTAVVLGGAVAAAENAAGLTIVQSLVSWGIVVAYALFVTLLQGRSETMSALSGRPVDERWELIHQRALALTAEVGTGVAILGYIVAEFRHAESGPFGFVAATMGFTYLAGIAIFRRRI